MANIDKDTANTIGNKYRYFFFDISGSLRYKYSPLQYTFIITKIN